MNLDRPLLVFGVCDVVMLSARRSLAYQVCHQHKACPALGMVTMILHSCWRKNLCGVMCLPQHLRLGNSLLSARAQQIACVLAQRKVCRCLVKPGAATSTWGILTQQAGAWL